MSDPPFPPIQPADHQPLDKRADPVPKPESETGDSDRGSQDAEGEEDVEGESVRLDAKDEVIGTGEARTDIPSPYLDSHRPQPRITLRVNHLTSVDKDMDSRSPPETMDLDLPRVPASPRADINQTNGTERSHQPEPAKTRLQTPDSAGSVTPPASPLRSFIAPPAHAPHVAAPAVASTPATSARPLVPRGPPNRTATIPPPSLSSAAVYTSIGSSTGPTRPEMSVQSAPARNSVGSLWKTSGSSKSKPNQETREEEEDVDMGEDDEDEEDELDDEDYRDDSEAVPTPPASAGPSRAKRAGGSALAGAAMGSGDIGAKAKRATRGPGKKQKVKAKEREKGKGKENARPEDSGRTAGQREEPVEVGGKEGRPDYAYEYVPVAQRREGRQHIKYEMSMRQQPLQARMCNAGEKADRRPIDPPPIIQLKVIDPDDETGTDKSRKGKKIKREPGTSFMHNPYFFLYATLVGSDEAQTELHVTDDGKTRFLTGTPVSSLYYLKDMNHRDAAFFVFPDLGVRKEGQYKLKLTLFEIVDQEVFYCATSFTDTFSVLSAKKFPGMQQATELSRSFADQGLKIRVRKETKKRASGLPPRNKRRSSITGEELYHPKRPRGSTDSSYAGPHFTYDEGYPHAPVNGMLPPPVPNQSSRPIVHPPPLREPQQQLHHHHLVPSSSRKSIDYSADSPYSVGHPELPIPLKQATPIPGRSEGIPFSGHPVRSQTSIPPPSPSRAQPSGATPTREAAYFHDERERQRHLDIQQSQRREIDARRQAEAAKIAENDRNRLYQQSRQEAQQHERLQQLAHDRATHADHPAGSPFPPPRFADRGGYAPHSAGTQPSSFLGPPYRPATAPTSSASDFDIHEREQRRALTAKRQDAEESRRGEYHVGMPGPSAHDPVARGSDERRYYQHYPEQQYVDHEGRGEEHHHPSHLHRHPAYPPQYPHIASGDHRERYPPTPPGLRDPRDHQASRGSIDRGTRREYEGEGYAQGDAARIDPYSTPNSLRQQHQRPPSAHYAPYPPPSSAHHDRTPQQQPIIHHPRSTSTSLSARSTPQTVRTPHDTDILPLAAHSAPLSQPSGKVILTNHYEPTSRSSLARLQTDKWAESSPRSLSFGSGDKDRESLTLPSISTLTTPAHSRQGTPSTPATTVTPGRDHRLGLGHLVD